MNLTRRHLVVHIVEGKKQLLSIDDHKQYIETKLKQSAEKYRPDIVHRSVLAVFDSPLSKARMVKLFIHTSDKQIISINPEMRVSMQ